ncbi:uncharacterized protein AC631_00057 [Debaryomyces fabryi]|uniref:PSP1 C-terminal domain-containing protein n=1 Tax=Debaryomyces fabryi TaxID=58627 RepID=A0A0V1Q749_9ASCO|nr:uncharacterized protein AC631_00057 [Debaryomyces fabryi]KSA04186.1 hypothetical protein AC631_00057 [Debaryomyces fabryi]CUM46243.1 unnamed protein product [Debaryomyces fabryi]
MNFNYPDFLQERPDKGVKNQFGSTGKHENLANESKNESGESENDRNNGSNNFNSILFNKLTNLESGQSQSPTSRGHGDMNASMMSPMMGSQFQSQGAPGGGIGLYGQKGALTLHDSFNLPVELQGGVGTISSRRPSYAAESFTRSNLPINYNNFLNMNLNQGGASHPDESQEHVSYNNDSNKGGSEKNSLATFAAANNYSNNNSGNSNNSIDMSRFNDSFNNIDLNANFNDFQSRRPSQLVGFQSNFNPYPPPLNYMPQPMQTTNSVIKLENGLMLRDQYIVASPNLKSLYMKTARYFQNVETSEHIISQLNELINNPVIIKLITFIKNLNNLTFNHKILCLVINKNGKSDLLSYPNNSNIFLQKHNLVIVDGDRGKDLVMILEPLVNLNFAILFNFLKKLEHLKSLTINDSNQSTNNNLQLQLKGAKKPSGGTHSTSINASTIVNSHNNEDNEFIITLPTKQVLRFATPKEVHKISGKFLEEKKAFITCFNKIKELNLNNDLQLINVEYQSDFKKLIFYYFAGFKRIDFRGLIKELFKIYKTRIWLCAVLPFDKPELYITLNEKDDVKEPKNEIKNYIPNEYELSNEQILNFSINEFQNLADPNYFHLVNLKNLIRHLSNEITGDFYGFNNKTDSDPSAPPHTSSSSSSIPPTSSSSAATNITSGGIFDHYDSNINFSNNSNILPNFNPFGDDKNHFQMNR